MNILLTISLAIKGLLANKIRAFLTILGIIIGVAGIIMIVSVGNGAESLIVNQIKSVGSNLIGILPGGREEGEAPAAAYGIVITTLKSEDIKALKEIPHVVGVAGYTKSVLPIFYKNKKAESTVTGTSADYPAVEDAAIDGGRFFNDIDDNSISKVAVLGSQIKYDLFGDMNPVGENIKIKNETFKVIGYMQERGASGFTNNDTLVFIPVKTMQKLILGTNHISMGRVKVDNAEYMDAVVEDIERILRTRHGISNPKDDDFTVASQEQGLQILTNVTGSIKLLLTAIAAIALIVGGIGIMNVMFIAVTERTHEIGLRKAIGAKRQDIMKQFLIEAVAITSLGGILGIIIGGGFSALVAFTIQYLGYDWDLIVTPDSIIIAAGVIVGIGIIFGYAPAKKASLLSPIDALRYE
ncbi:ABC transporter permease [Candidatus Peregrinibacteria bacterium]|nr:ABC transporter permease [Candidatus Peregrinibacteria bacterium]